MAKGSGSLGGPAGLADWLPLLGSICQALSSIGEEPSEGEAREDTGAADDPAAAPPHSSSSASQ